MNIGIRKTLLCLMIVLLMSASGFSRESDVHLNKVVSKLKNNTLVTGIWGKSMDLYNAMSIVQYNGFPTQEEALSRPMIDFVLIEMEHAPYDINKLRTFLLGLNSRREVVTKGNLQPSVAAFVRIPIKASGQVHIMIEQVLDVGAHGIVIPHVHSAQDVLKIVKACRYPQPANSPYKKPHGARGASPHIAAYLWGLDLEEYTKRADVWPLNPRGDLMVLIMIEDVDGVNNIDEILKVPGIGAVIFGPYDYSFSTGNFGNRKAAVVTEALKKVKKACDKAGVPLVGFANPENIEQVVKDDYKMLIIGSDIDKAGEANTVLEYLRSQDGKGGKP